jgi:alpha-tubulin suppressor-like RCC1 family protein
VCAIRGADVWCWGSYVADVSQGIATDYRPPARLQVPGGAVEVALGDAHGCARNASGEVYCWGANLTCARGRPASRALASTPERAQIGACSAQQIVVLEEITLVRCDDGVIVVGGCSEGDASCALVRPLLGAGGAPLRDAAALGPGIVLTDDGRLLRWGSDDSGQISRTLPAAAPREAGEPRVPRLLVSTPTLVPELPPLLAAADPRAATCVLTREGDVRCWGHNGVAELGVLPEPWESESAWDRRLAARHRTVELQAPAGLGRARRLWCGFEACCAEEEDRSISCWGHNTAGRIDPSAERLVAPTRMPPARVREIAIGARFICLEEDAPGHPISCTGVPPATVMDLDMPEDHPSRRPRARPERIELPAD